MAHVQMFDMPGLLKPYLCVTVHYRQRSDKCIGYTKTIDNCGTVPADGPTRSQLCAVGEGWKQHGSVLQPGRTQLHVERRSIHASCYSDRRQLSQLVTPCYEVVRRATSRTQYAMLMQLGACMQGGPVTRSCQVEHKPKCNCSRLYDTATPDI